MHSRGHQQRGVGFISVVDCHAVGGGKLAFFVARAAEFVDVLARRRVAQHPLRAVAIGDVDRPVRADGRFGGLEIHLFFVSTNLRRMFDGQQHFALHVRLDDLAQVGVTDEEEFLAVGVPECQPVAAGVFVSPTVE